MHPSLRILFRGPAGGGAAAILAALVLLLTLFASAAQAPADPKRLEAIGATLQAIEDRLNAPRIFEKDLSEIRAAVDPLVGELRAAIAAEEPRKVEIERRLKQLGETPPPGSQPVESPEVAKDREEQKRRYAEVQDRLRFANSLSARADTALLDVVDRRRSLFTAELLAPSASLLSPQLWVDVARSLPDELSDLFRIAGLWRSSIAESVGFAQLGMLLLAFAVLVFAYRPMRRFLHALERRDPEAIDPPRLNKAAAALKVLFATSAPPIILATIAYMVLNGLGFLPGRLPEIAAEVARGIAFIGFARALGWAILPADKPNWRIFKITDAQARLLQRLMTTAALILVAGKVVEALNRVIFAGLPLTVAARGIAAVLFSLVILNALRRSSQDDPPLLPRLRLALFAASSLILLSALFSYVALASFLCDQTVWIISIGVLLALLLMLVDDGVGRGLSSEGKLGQQIRQLIGLRTGLVDQFSVLASALIRLSLIILALFLVLAPWGVDGADLRSTLSAAFFGFTFGGITISLSTVALALALFIGGFVLTRGAQRWLGQCFLPQTNLDLGIRNSISTSFGYVGVIVAAVVALSFAGLSLDRLAIVAGALSVGIGFGLQSIVNNFVSGLILLWERPLKVGDWLEIGQEHGTVRNIRVRSTEIETFDKASLIVPNSEFISGRVKNWVHSGRKIRVVIPIPVNHDCDPRIVEALLLEAALGHREVESEPRPKVFFRKITPETLEFELVMFTDADALAPTRSDVLFDIAERFRDKGLSFRPAAVAPAIPAG